VTWYAVQFCSACAWLAAFCGCDDTVQEDSEDLSPPEGLLVRRCKMQKVVRCGLNAQLCSSRSRRDDFLGPMF
jgi:hypothetical protein